MSKVLANRLRKVVGNVVSEAQPAFVKARQILVGILNLIVNELVDDACRLKKVLILFKIDLEKAYDSVDLRYLGDVLIKMNFPLFWHEWDLECVTTTTTSVLVNGSPTNKFRLKRGLCEGDPISPFMYLLVAKSLNVIMNTLVEMVCLQGLVYGKLRLF